MSKSLEIQEHSIRAMLIKGRQSGAKFGLGKHLVAVGLPNTEKILKVLSFLWPNYSLD